MPIPEIRMTFDETNLSTFVKELLCLTSGTELLHKRFDAKIIFKCNGDIEKVREDVFTWLKIRSVGKESEVTDTVESNTDTETKLEPTPEATKNIRDEIAARLNKNKEEAECPST